MLENLINYYDYAPLIQTGNVTINPSTITKENWKNHYDGILNIMKDGIETDFVHVAFITIKFENEEPIRLTIPDMFFNLMMWYPFTQVGLTIQPWHLFSQETITGNDVKEYLDKYFIEIIKTKISNKRLNNIIAEFLYHFIDIDNFSFYLANTINLEDDLDLITLNKEFAELSKCDLSNVPIEQVRNAGMDVVNKAKKIITNSRSILGYDHCLKTAFDSKESINPRQYKEFAFNIGTKPDGQGSIYHEAINQSFTSGGLNNLIYQFIESGASRVAQIIAKKSVGDSGGFARILGLNNMNIFLNPDPTYDCHSHHPLAMFIENEDILNLLWDRYYYNDPEGNGIEHKIHRGDSFLIGKTIYVRSPETCISNAQGHGVCYHCYGDLAYTNSDIGIGKIAADTITSQQTQLRLSAKHILDTVIKIIKWCQYFNSFFEVDTNEIKINSLISDKDLSGYKMIINTESLQLENDDEFYKHNYFIDTKHEIEDSGPFYNEYVTNFDIKCPNNDIITIQSLQGNDESSTRMYLSSFINNKIRSKYNSLEEDSTIELNLEELKEQPLFMLKMENNDIGKSLDIFTDLINKKEITKNLTIEELTNKLQHAILKGNIHCMSIHLEILVTTQLRDVENSLKPPKWDRANTQYELMTLGESLKNNPSIAVSLEYQCVQKTFCNPLNYQKIEPSVFDPFFISKPLKFFNNKNEIYDLQNKPIIKKGQSPVVIFHNHNGKAPSDINKIVDKFKPKNKDDDNITIDYD